MTGGQRLRVHGHEGLVSQGLHKTKGQLDLVPPLALRKIAVEQLWAIKHMYPESQHILLCPTLMKHQWGRMLSRIADKCFIFKRNSCLWNKDLHKPLTIAFIAPLLSSAPWKLS